MKAHTTHPQTTLPLLGRTVPDASAARGGARLTRGDFGCHKSQPPTAHVLGGNRVNTAAPGNAPPSPTSRCRQARWAQATRHAGDAP